MDFNKFCSEVLKINPKIRFTGVYSTVNGDIWYKMQEGIVKVFDDEQTKDTMVHGYMRWKNRMHAADIIGTPIYTMTKYPKMTRITLPCGSNALIMISTEIDLEPVDLVDDVCKLREKYADDKDYEPRSQTC